jgi:hypothetical protein
MTELEEKCKAYESALVSINNWRKNQDPDLKNCVYLYQAESVLKAGGVLDRHGNFVQ